MYRVLAATIIISIFSTTYTSNSEAGEYSLLGSEFDFAMDVNVTPLKVLSFGSEKVKAKSEWVALGYAVFPGYFIPTAFGHAYAEAHVEAAALSATRLAGRIMWFHAFFDSLMVDGSGGAIQGERANLLFYVGLALDIGGYLYDILHAPLAVASHNARLAKKPSPRVAPFIDIIDDGPICGLEFRF